MTLYTYQNGPIFAIDLIISITKICELRNEYDSSCDGYAFEIIFIGREKPLYLYFDQDNEKNAEKIRNEIIKEWEKVKINTKELI